MTLVRLALAALLVLLGAPLLALVATVPPGDVLAALRAPGTVDALRTSLGASLASTALATILGVPAGYALARTGPRRRSAGLLVLVLPLALPPVASGIALLGLLGRHRPLGALAAAAGVPLVDSFGGVFVAEFFVSASVVAIAAAAAFADVDATLEEAARTLGASPARVFGSIAIPLAAPGIGAGMLLAWLRALGEYGATSILAYHPASLPIALVIALSADGVPRALALAEAFVALAVLAVLVAAGLRRRVT